MTPSGVILIEQYRVAANLAREKKLSAFKHNGFWYPMDTLRDKKHLEDLWKSNNAPWKKWH